MLLKHLKGSSLDTSLSFSVIPKKLIAFSKTKFFMLHSCYFICNRSWYLGSSKKKIFISPILKRKVPYHLFCFATSSSLVVYFLPTYNNKNNNKEYCHKKHATYNLRKRKHFVENKIEYQQHFVWLSLDFFFFFLPTQLKKTSLNFK